MATTTRQHTLADPAGFFASLRTITGSLNGVQVATTNALLAAAGTWPVGWLAYALATAWHEARLIPQAEWGRGRGKPYGVPGKYGQAQYGRGLVQLTWDRNYEWADRALELNGALLADFNLALKPENAVKILIFGMKTGAFTGKSLSDYIPATDSPSALAPHSAFVMARRIINGTDRADQIAAYADRIQIALVKAGWA